MGEFSSRVEAQRKILKVVNSRDWSGEQLFSVTTAAIQRWASTNGLDTSTTVVKLLHSASAQIFVMANHSDDPIAGTYALSKQKVLVLARQVQEEISSWDSRGPGADL
jgi:hypothetical protein